MLALIIASPAFPIMSVSNAQHSYLKPDVRLLDPVWTVMLLSVTHNVHQGSMETAINLVQFVQDTDARCVKFQTLMPCLRKPLSHGSRTRNWPPSLTLKIKHITQVFWPPVWTSRGIRCMHRRYCCCLANAVWPRKTCDDGLEGRL